MSYQSSSRYGARKNTKRGGPKCPKCPKDTAPALNFTTDGNGRAIEVRPRCSYVSTVTAARRPAPGEGPSR